MSESVTVLPRFQQGARSQQLMTVLLGDYWHARDESLPSAALVELLQVFGVTAVGARAAVQRLAQRGFLLRLKIGRQTAYAVSRMNQARINAHVGLLFLGHLPVEWDRTWTLVAFSLPEDAKVTRHSLRENLRQRGFGNLYDALWARPGDHASDIDQIIESLSPELDPSQVTVFTGAQLPEGMGQRAVAAAFALDELADEYDAFVRHWEPLADRMRVGGDPWPQEAESETENVALRARTSIMTDWRELRHRDPRLPHELLGEGFPLHRAVEICTVVYDGLGSPAEAAVRRILRRHGDGLANLVTHHTFAASASLMG